MSCRSPEQTGGATRRDGAAARPRASLAAKLALAVGTVVLEIAAFELALQITGLQPPQPLTWVGDHVNEERKQFVADEEIGWKMRPGTRFTWRVEGESFDYLADAAGFRIDERRARGKGAGGKEGATSTAAGATEAGALEPSTDPNAPLLAAVGDSFTWGTGVTYAQTWGAQVAARLGARCANFGQPGFGVDQMWRTVEHHALPAKPAAMVCAFILDDLERSLHAWRWVEGFTKPRYALVDGELVRQTDADRPNALLRLLDAESHLYAGYRGWLRRTGMLFPIGEWYGVNAACLRAAAAAAKAQGVPFAVLWIPTHPTRRAFTSLATELAAAGIPFLDPWSANGGLDPADYWPKDGHLNARGHANLADFVAAQLTTRFPGAFARRE